MAGFLQALGRSQAISGVIGGVQGMEFNNERMAALKGQQALNAQRMKQESEVFNEGAPQRALQSNEARDAMKIVKPVDFINTMARKDPISAQALGIYAASQGIDINNPVRKWQVQPTLEKLKDPANWVPPLEQLYGQQGQRSGNLGAEIANQQASVQADIKKHRDTAARNGVANAALGNDAAIIDHLSREDPKFAKRVAHLQELVKEKQQLDQTMTATWDKMDQLKGIAQLQGAIRQTNEKYPGALTPDDEGKLYLAQQTDPRSVGPLLLHMIQSPKAPATRKIQQGTENITQQWDPKSGKWESIATGPRFNPKAPLAGGPAFKDFDSTGKVGLFMDYAILKRTPQFAWGDKQSRSEFMKEYTRWRAKTGITTADIASGQAQVKALNYQTNQSTQIGQFVENLNTQINHVRGMEKAVISRIGVRALDLPIRKLKTIFIGSGYEKALESYTIEISNEIGKLSTNSQGSIRELSTEAQDRWAKIHDVNLSFRELDKILSATQEQARIRNLSALDTINYLKENINASGGMGTASTQPTEVGAAPTKGTVKDGYRYKGGDPSKPESWEVGAGGGTGASAKTAPTKGTVKDGYRYKGGDPSKPESWVKVK